MHHGSLTCVAGGAKRPLASEHFGCGYHRCSSALLGPDPS
jgi:hypothetical protein